MDKISSLRLYATHFDYNDLALKHQVINMLKDCRFLDYIKTVICSIVCVCCIAFVINFNNAISDTRYREGNIAIADMRAQKRSDLIDAKNDQLEQQMYYRK